MSRSKQPNARSKSSQKTSHPTEISPAAEEELPYLETMMSQSSQVSCDCCHQNITYIAHILCSWGDFCLGCFAKLKAFPPSYYIIEKLGKPLFDPQWSAHEELLLFNAIQRCGFGNWDQIRNQVGDSKTAQEVEKHYEKLFNKAGHPYPRVLNSKSLRCVSSIQQQEKEGKLMTERKFELNMMKEEMEKCEAKPENELRMVNYCSKRGDFEIEFDNDLELIISELEFKESDSPQEVAMKEEVLKIYNQRLQRRNTIKDFVIERKLLDLKELLKKDRRRTKEEREIAAMLIPFARFTTAVEHEELVAGVIREKALRHQIAAYIEERRKGYKSLNEYQENLLPRRKKLQMRRKMKCKPGAAKLPSLSKEEYQLCLQLQISQVTFVLMRETIRSEEARRGKLAVEHFYSIFRLKPAVVSQIVAFLAQAHPNR